MILDRMDRLSHYRGINSNLDRLIDYVLNCDFTSLKPGKTMLTAIIAG